MKTPGSMKSFSAHILHWFDMHGRHDLPWQHPRSPYRVWLSEVMLQQTQVKTVIPYFERFIRQFPTLPTLANADLDEVFALWAGLGYYSRARNLHNAAKICLERHGNDLPNDFNALCALPGIGRSTAGAILAQAYGVRFAILDGNVKRVLCRYHGVSGWPGNLAVEKTLWRLAEQHLPKTRLADYTQAIMDFGATLCTHRNSACAICPLKKDCIALHENRIEQLPESKPGKTLPERHTIMLILHDNDGRVLLTRRPPTGVWSGMWSLPEAADYEQAREFVSHHAQIEFNTHTPLASIAHTFSHYRLHIAPLFWQNTMATLHINDNDQYRWQALSTLVEVGLPTPVRKLLGTLPIHINFVHGSTGSPRTV